MKKNTISKIIIKMTIIKRIIILKTKNLTLRKTNTFSKMTAKKILLNRIIMKELISKIANNNKNLFKMKNQLLKIKSKNKININYLSKKLHYKKTENLIKNSINMNKNHY